MLVRTSSNLGRLLAPTGPVAVALDCLATIVFC